MMISRFDEVAMEFMDGEANKLAMHRWSERVLRSRQLPEKGKVLLKVCGMPTWELGMENKEDRATAMFFQAWPWV